MARRSLLLLVGALGACAPTRQALAPGGERKELTASTPAPAAEPAVLWEDEAELYVREILSPHPTPEAFSGLEKLLPSLGPARLESLARLGGTADAPIYVPNIGAEYWWVKVVACRGLLPDSVEQGLVAGAQGPLDSLTYECRGVKRTTYFDFRDDLVEKLFSEPR